MSSKINKVNYLVYLALLVAIQILLTSTNLGYLPIGPVHITLVHIPVLVAAMVLGPVAGGILGLSFGITSMIMATMSASLDSIVFSPVLSGSPLSLMVAVVPRVLFGLIAGWLFILLQKWNCPMRLNSILSAVISTFLHSIMVLGSIYLFLGQTYADLTSIAYSTLLAVFGGVILSNGSIEAVVAAVVCVATVKPLRTIVSSSKRRSYEREKKNV